MSKKTKLLERLRQKPKDFTWDEATALLNACGFSLFKNNGSRRKFVHQTTKRVLSLHEPHPQPVLKKYALDDIEQALIDHGEMSE